MFTAILLTSASLVCVPSVCNGATELFSQWHSDQRCVRFMSSERPGAWWSVDGVRPVPQSRPPYCTTVRSKYMRVIANDKDRSRDPKPYYVVLRFTTVSRVFLPIYPITIYYSIGV